MKKSLIEEKEKTRHRGHTLVSATKGTSSLLLQCKLIVVCCFIQPCDGGEAVSEVT